MIQRLRQRHRRMVLTLGLILPVAVLTGVVARKQIPSMDSVPSGLTPVTPKLGETAWDRSDLFEKATIGVRLLSDPAIGGRVGLQFSAAGDFVKPDLLVYLLDAETNSGVDTLPPNAQLLGAFASSSTFTLPKGPVTPQSRLLLYSLANGEVIDISKPFSVAKP